MVLTQSKRTGYDERDCGFSHGYQLPATSYQSVKPDEEKTGSRKPEAGSLSKSDFMFHVKGLNESRTIGKVIDEII